MDKKRHTLNLPPFPTFSVDKPSKAPRIFHHNATAAAAGGVGLAIVAAMNHITTQKNINSPQESAYKCTNLAVSPRSNPIPIISSAAKAAAHFRGGLNFESGSGNEGGVVDESDDESYTCVISYVGNHVIKKQFHYGDGPGVAFCGGDDSIKNISEVKPALFFASTSPMILTINDDEDGWEGRRGFWTQDFLTSCYLCNKLLHGLDIFMYRGEKAFCSAECRDKQIMSDKYKEKCGCEARKGHDYSKSPCSSPQVVFAEVAAA